MCHVDMCNCIIFLARARFQSGQEQAGDTTASSIKPAPSVCARFQEIWEMYGTCAVHIRIAWKRNGRDGHGLSCLLQSDIRFSHNSSSKQFQTIVIVCSARSAYTVTLKGKGDERQAPATPGRFGSLAPPSSTARANEGRAAAVRALSVISTR